MLSNNNCNNNTKKYKFKLINGFKDNEKHKKEQKRELKRYKLLLYAGKLLNKINDNHYSDLSIHHFKYQLISLIIKNNSYFFHIASKDKNHDENKEEYLKKIKKDIIHQNIILCYMRDFTIKELSNIFPPMKTYDGDKYGCKDYFYSKEIIKNMGGENKKIDTYERALYFINEYPNNDIIRFAIMLIKTVSKNNELTGSGESFVDFLMSNNIHSYHSECLDSSKNIHGLFNDNGKFIGVITPSTHNSCINRKINKNILHIVK